MTGSPPEGPGPRNDAPVDDDPVDDDPVDGDPVDDLAPGTYVADIELVDRGTIDANVNYKTPTVARVTFQVKTATEEKAPACRSMVCAAE